VLDDKTERRAALFETAVFQPAELIKSGYGQYGRGNKPAIGD
jgi:hypothetical protein